jgi:hypothetical protein
MNPPFFWMNDYIWEIKRRNLNGKHKKVAKFIETKNGELVSTCSATAALIRQETGLWVSVF